MPPGGGDLVRAPPQAAPHDGRNLPLVGIADSRTPVQNLPHKVGVVERRNPR
jgi:hypothetical protein